MGPQNPLVFAQNFPWLVPTCPQARPRMRDSCICCAQLENRKVWAAAWFGGVSTERWNGKMQQDMEATVLLRVWRFGFRCRQRAVRRNEGQKRNEGMEYEDDLWVIEIPLLPATHQYVR